VDRYGPINPLLEVLLFLAFVSANVWMGREQALNEVARRQLWDRGLVVVFVVMVTILCVRAVRRRTVTRAFSTAGLFGFSAGAILWSLYILTEHASEGLGLSYQMIPSVIGYGMACSAIALLLSALEVSIYCVIKRKAVR
jgi:hypothetical protein